MHPDNIELDKARKVLIKYTNYKGEYRGYTIIPHSIHFGKNEFHPEVQWMMLGTDVDRNVLRTFTLKDIHSWEPVK